MNLKDLPNYFDSLKEEDRYTTSVLVDMGRIESSNIFRNSILFSSFCVALFFIAFSSFSENITLTTDLSAQELSLLVSDNGGRIVSIEQNEDKTYKIKVLTFWKNSFLDRLRKNKDIEMD
jgi:hypothetical protein